MRLHRAAMSTLWPGAPPLDGEARVKLRSEGKRGESWQKQRAY